MKKFKNSEIINAMNILGVFEDKKLPQKISYAILKNSSIISNEYNIYSKSLKKLFDDYDEYFEKDKDGNLRIDKVTGVPLVKDREIKNEFSKELEDLLLTEVEIDLYYIPENVFEYDDSNGRYDPLTAKEIFLLMNLICKGEDKKKE